VKISKNYIAEKLPLLSVLSYAFSLAVANIFSHLYLTYSRFHPQPTFGPTIITTGMPSRVQLIFFTTLCITYILGTNTPVLRPFFKYQRIRIAATLSVVAIPVLIQFSDVFFQRGVLSILLIYLVLFEVVNLSEFGKSGKSQDLLKQVSFFAIILALVTIPGVLVIPKLGKSLWLESTSLLVVLVVGALVSGILLMAALPPIGKPQIGFVVGGIVFCIFIPWQQMQWRTDGFHDAEIFLAQNTIAAGYSPQHGLGRISWPTYLTDFLATSPSDLYATLIGSKLLFGLVAPVVIFTILKISQSIQLTVLLAATFVLGYIFTPQDINIATFTLLFLVFSIKRHTFQSHIGKYSLVFLFSLSILYSIETLLFGLLSIVALLLITGRIFVREISLFALMQLSFLIFPQVRSMWSYIPDALTQDGNLLERPFVLSANYESIFIIVSFAILIFLFPPVILDVVKKSKSGDFKSAVVFLIFSSSLLMVSRSFNRADLGHILYGLQFLPFILLAYWVRIQNDILPNQKRKLNTEGILILIFTPLLCFGFFLNHGKTQSVGSHYFYGLSSSSTVPNSTEFSGFKIPNNDFFQIYSDKEALDRLESILKSNFVLDLSNNLVATQILSGSRVAVSPINLLVGSGSGEQRLVDLIDRQEFDTVIWASNHWSQNLDGVSFEDRTPLLVASILKKYQFSEKIGDFVLFKPVPNTSEFSYIPYSDNSILWSYNLGFAPQATKPLDGDHLRFESKLKSNIPVSVDINCQGKQIEKGLNFKVLINNQHRAYYINLSNRYSYLLLKTSGNFECTSNSGLIKNLSITSE
jgi:hypothetical protein